MACLQSRSFCNEILVEALPCLQPWFSSKVTNLAVGSQAQYLPSLTLSFPICKMYWPVCLPVFTWLLHSINEMSVKCMAQKGGSTKDDDYHGPNFTKFSEVLRQGLGAEEGRDPRCYLADGTITQFLPRPRAKSNLGSNLSPTLPR